jgi:L-rhamnose mutarotase
MVLLSTGLKQQKQVYVTNDFDDQSLPLPPMTQMINAAGLNNYEIYSKTSQGVNGSVTQIQIQQNVMQQQRMNNMAQMNATQQNNTQKIYSSERPMLPPPPIPAQNHLSDLQQIQQQMIRKKNSDYTNGHSNNIENGHNLHENNNNGNSNDLPPPPSPPHMEIHLMNSK